MNKICIVLAVTLLTLSLFSNEGLKNNDKIYYNDGKYAGQTVQIATRFWLDGKTDITDGIQNLSVTQPSGFRLPDKKDLELLLKIAKNQPDPQNFIREKLKLNKSERYLMSSLKVYQNKNDGSDIDAWKFWGLDLQKMSIEQIATYAIVHEWQGSKKSEYSARLIANIDPISIVFNGIGGLEREFECNLPGVESYLWIIEDAEYTGKLISHSFSYPGIYSINLSAISESGTEEYSKEVSIKKSYGSNKDATSIYVKNIVSCDLDFICSYPEYNRYGYNKLQTAPLICADSEKILILSSDQNKILNLIETDLDGAVLSKKELNGGYPGNLSYKDGVIAYLTKIGNDRADLRFVDAKGTNRVIMDNIGSYDSNTPGTKNSGKGMIFRDKNGKMIFGTEAMFEPFSFGRVELFSVDGGWISIFPHSNNFNASNVTAGKFAGEKSNYHSGEMCLYFNNDASETNLIYGWGASHSMDLRSVYDGEYIASITLGDVYPCDFRFFLIDTKNKKFIQKDIFASNKYKDALIGYTKDGKEYYGVAGGPGSMSAKLGEVMVIGYGKYAFTYSIKTGEFNNSYIAKGGVFKSNINELGLIILDRTGSTLTRKKIRDGNDIEFLNSAKYGKNILLAWKTVDKNEYKMCLTDTNGNIIQNEFTLPENIYFNPSDGFDVLSNGNIAWTAVKDTVEKNGSLRLFILKLPE